jgi:hypothetical protein
MEPKNSAKVFSFVDSPDSSRVKSHRGRHNGGVAPEGAIRAATDRAVKDRKHPLYRCSGRTYLGNRLIPSSWPIDSQNRWRDRTELEPNPSILNAPEAKEIPVWQSQSSRGSGGKKKTELPESETEIRSRLATEVEVLRRCTDWLQRLERGENVVVNLRPAEDFETEFVAFDRPRVVRVLERIAADLDTLQLGAE